MKNFLILLILFSLSACATSPTGRSQLMLVSPAEAISSSREAYVQTLLPLQKEGKVDSNAVTSQRIRLITGRIISQAILLYPHTRNWEWSVKVIDDPEMVNAWCMAGGKMAIYTGLIDKLDAAGNCIRAVLCDRNYRFPFLVSMFDTIDSVTKSSRWAFFNCIDNILGCCTVGVNPRLFT